MSSWENASDCFALMPRPHGLSARAGGSRRPWNAAAPDRLGLAGPTDALPRPGAVKARPALQALPLPGRAGNTGIAGGLAVVPIALLCHVSIRNRVISMQHPSIRCRCGEWRAMIDAVFGRRPDRDGRDSTEGMPARPSSRKGAMCLVRASRSNRAGGDFVRIALALTALPRMLLPNCHPAFPRRARSPSRPS
jgi:hypothetical protein